MKIETETKIHLDLTLDKEEKQTINDMMTLLVVIQNKASNVKDLYLTDLCKITIDNLIELSDYHNDIIE